MRVDDLRQELESLAESAPVPPHDPGAAVRRGRARRARAWLLRAAAATTVGVVVVAALVRIERDPQREVVRAGPGPSSSSPSLLGGRALPPSGLIVLDSPRNGGSQQPASWSIALLDDEGRVLAQLPRATIDNDVFNQHWNLRVVATNTEVSIEHPPLDADADAPSGCTITVRPGPVALCGLRSPGDQLLGTRIMVRVGDGWSTLIGVPPTLGGPQAGGHWSWAAPSPDGRWVLAQWSGECERQTGMLISVADGSVHALTGEAGTAWAAAPSSQMLGWTPSGQAIFQLEASCDEPARSPGIYIVAPANSSKRLVRALSPTAVVLRWTTLSDRRTPSAPTTTAPVFSLGDVGLTASYIPAGFVPVDLGHPESCGSCPRHVDGPVPGWTHDSQRFQNDATGQAFTIYVTRGRPSSYIFAPNQVSPYVRSPRRGGGHETYVHTVHVAGIEREFTWIIGPTTTGGVVGISMTDDELLPIADAMQITP